MSWTRSYLAVCISDVTNKVIPSSLSEMSWTRSYLAVCISDVMNKVIPSSMYQWYHENDVMNRVMPGSLLEYQWHHEQAWQMYLPLPPNPTTVQTTHLHKHACKRPYLEHLQWYTHKVLQNKNKNKKSALVLKLLGIHRLLSENVAKVYDENPQDQNKQKRKEEWTEKI